MIRLINKPSFFQARTKKPTSFYLGLTKRLTAAQRIAREERWERARNEE